MPNALDFSSSPQLNQTVCYRRISKPDSIRITLSIYSDVSTKSIVSVNSRRGTTGAKLSVRAISRIGSEEALKIEVSNSRSLHHLSQATMSSSSSLDFSLNMRDVLDESSSNTSLQSLGDASGDIFFHSVNPNSLSFSPNAHRPILQNGLGNFSSQDSMTWNSETPVQICSNDATPEPKVEIFGTPVGDSPNWAKTLVQDSNGHERSEGNMLNFVAQREVAQEFTVAEDVMEKKISEVCFLRRVLREEMGDDCNVHKLLVIAVHAVLLETGFVGFDRLHLPDDWSSTPFAMSIRYTLPGLLVNGSNSCETVVLKFQCLGQFVSVYGSLANEGSGLHWVCLNGYRFAPTIDLVWARNYSSYGINGRSEFSRSSYPENEVVEFWKIVKDDLALPLLIDLCEKSRLLPPPCFMGLPSEIKLKILESLTGLDVAKACCVCSELKYLASNSDLWKQKVFEEFGCTVMTQEIISWKETFASSWELKKRMMEAMPCYLSLIEDPDPLDVPCDDLLFELGAHSPIGQDFTCLELWGPINIPILPDWNW